MAGGFSSQILDEIRSRVDMVELVGQSVNLKRAGENWKGLCPFHTEKTPSFTVNPKRGIFHCFGCGVGGDAFGFLMRQDRLGFPEAVRALAQRAGVEIPTQRSPESNGKLEGLRHVMALAAQFYTDALWAQDGAKARAYVESRCVSLEVARRFGLGYAPEGWNALLSHMAKEGVSDAELVSAGLALPRQNATGFYDRFRGRLLFPIRDLQARVVAFGGRAMGAEEPKYLNSPETPLYVKGQMLYALDMAREGMRQKNRAVVVEGYLDCLMAHQHGFTETVAALGTAFTAAQLALLRRYADEVVSVFDADAAGQKATSRLEEMLTDVMDLRNLGWSVSRTGSFEKAGYFPIKVAVLPEGHDPDSLLRAEGAQALQARLDAARSILRPRPRLPHPLPRSQRRRGDSAGPGSGPQARRRRHPALDRSPAASGRPSPKRRSGSHGWHDGRPGWADRFGPGLARPEPDRARPHSVAPSLGGGKDRSPTEC